MLILDYLIIKRSGFFDTCYYLKNYDDVRQADIDPTLHFIRYGWKEGRNPSPHFNTSYYLNVHTDVRAAGTNPFVHYIRHGIKEKRAVKRANDGCVKPTDSPTHLNGSFYNTEGENSATYSNSFDEESKKIIKLYQLFDPLKSCILDVPSCEEVKSWAEQINLINSTLPITNDISISIIIPVYNQIRYTLACIHSIIINSCRYDFEIIVADDLSDDLTQQVFTNYLCNIERIKYQRNISNLGFLKNCNKAVDRSRGKHLVFLNNDTVVQDKWLDELIRTLEDNADIGLTGSKLIYPDGRLQEAGGIIFEDGSGWNYGRLKDPSAPEFNYMRDVDYCSGASVAIKKDIWFEIGGFNTQFAPAYYEDTDLAFRVRAAGKRVVYQPLSEVIHFEGISHGRSVEEGIKIYQGINREKFYLEWNKELLSHGTCHDLDLPVERNIIGRILFVDAYTPTPDKDSGSLDTFNYLKLFKEFGFHVTFVPDNVMYNASYTKELQRIGVETIFAPWVNSSKEAVQKFAPLADIIILSRVNVAYSLVDIVREIAPHAKIIFDTVDVHFLREGREAELLNSANLKKKANKTRQLELNLINKADATLLRSTYEIEMLKEIAPDAKLVHMPIIRNIPGFINVPWDDRKDILFIGGFEHPPNLDAVKYFVEYIMPLLRMTGFKDKFIIAGSKMTEEVKALEADDIVIRGFVPNLDEIFGRCRLTVAPLRYGAGVKGKVVSSLSYGVPCVATSIAVEGSGFIDGEHLLVEDEPLEFAKAVSLLYNEKELWHDISEKGLEFCINTYSIKSVKCKLKSLLEEFVEM